MQNAVSVENKHTHIPAETLPDIGLLLDFWNSHCLIVNKISAYTFTSEEKKFVLTVCLHMPYSSCG